jgi:putative redox protein
MAKARVVWVEKGQFVGTDSSRHAVVMSTQDEENGTGVKPSDLLLISLGACSSVDVVKILGKKRMPLSRLEVEISGEQDADPPWTYRRAHLHYRLAGPGLTEEAAQQAITLSEEKYCSVAASLRPTVAISTDFEILPAEE